MCTGGRRALLTGWRVPQPYPGELGYSVVARYVERWGRLDPVGLLTQVFGYRPSSAHPACPPALGKLASTIYDTTPDAVSLFISKHTLVPYYLAFGGPALAARTLSTLRNDERACAIKVLGTSALRHSAPAVLRACRACLQADRDAGIEQHWRRVHQLPGVFHCFTHRDRLYDSSIPFELDRRLDFRTVNVAEIQSSLRPAGPPVFGRDLERRITAQSARLLDGNGSYFLDGSMADYRRRLMQFGFGGRRNELRISAFEKDFMTWLSRHGCNPLRLGTGRWWLRMLTAIPGRSLVLQHLTLQEFLRDKMSSYLRTNPDLFGYE